MAEFGNYVIYLIMLGAVLGALASILRPESGLGREFVNGIHAIGPVFLAQAGIMVAIPYLSRRFPMPSARSSRPSVPTYPSPRCRSSRWTWAATSWPMP